MCVSASPRLRVSASLRRRDVARAPSPARVPGGRGGGVKSEGGWAERGRPSERERASSRPRSHKRAQATLSLSLSNYLPPAVARLANLPCRSPSRSASIFTTFFLNLPLLGESCFSPSAPRLALDFSPRLYSLERPNDSTRTTSLAKEFLHTGIHATLRLRTLLIITPFLGHPLIPWPPCPNHSFSRRLTRGMAMGPIGEERVAFTPDSRTRR
jgi:hypothetical protein